MKQEITWVEELSKGNERAFKQMYEEYHGQLYFFALRFVKSKELAEEIVHDVFLKVWETKNSLDTTLSFKSYLYTITKNLVLNILTRAEMQLKIKNEIVLYAPRFENFVENEVIYNEYETIAYAAISRLPIQRQLVFRMCRLEVMSYEEVAKKLGISKGTVSDHMVKAIKFIKDFMMKNADVTLSVLVMYYLVFLG
jgi:RNA polymerase sigma-70 factor (ECF subfamily)